LGYRQQYPAFRQDLKYDGQLMLQIQSCRHAFNIGDKKLIRDTVESLMSMITPDIAQDTKNIFFQDMTELEDWWMLEKHRMESDYNEKVKEMNCPDVYPKPWLNPPTEYYRRKYIIILACLQRKGLLLKKHPVGDL
jgi:hypothetical protein